MHLPEDLLRRARRKAAAEGRTLTALIEEGLRLVVDEHASADQSRRVLPPVSTAVGGVAPGMDLNDSATLQELEDLEYVQRLR